MTVGRVSVNVTDWPRFGVAFDVVRTSVPLSLVTVSVTALEVLMP